MLEKIEGRRKSDQQSNRWLDGITDSMDMSLSMLSFIWSRMRAAAQEISPQGTLRDCSGRGKRSGDRQYICDFGEG